MDAVATHGSRNLTCLGFGIFPGVAIAGLLAPSADPLVWLRVRLLVRADMVKGVLKEANTNATGPPTEPNLSNETTPVGYWRGSEDE